MEINIEQPRIATGEWKQFGEGKLKLFFVNKEGIIKSVSKKTKKEFYPPLKPNKIGYVLFGNSTTNARGVHRIVWEAFMGDIPNDYQIDHINHNRSDNRLENLRAVTILENNRSKRPTRKGYTRRALTATQRAIINTMNKQGYKTCDIARGAECPWHTVHCFLKRRGKR